MPPPPRCCRAVTSSLLFILILSRAVSSDDDDDLHWCRDDDDDVPVSSPMLVIAGLLAGTTEVHLPPMPSPALPPRAGAAGEPIGASSFSEQHPEGAVAAAVEAEKNDHDTRGAAAAAHR